MFKRRGLYFQANHDGGTGGDPDAEAKAKADADAKAKADADAQAEKKEKDFEAWLAKQPADIQKLYEDQVGNLKGALEKERRANKDAGKMQKRLEEFEAAEAKRKEEQMTKEQLLEKKAADAEAAKLKVEQELESERKRNAVTATAASLGFTDPEDAYTLADLSEIERGKDGKFTGIKEALEALAKSKPYLLNKNGKGDGLGNSFKKLKKPEGETQKVAGPAVRL